MASATVIDKLVSWTLDHDGDIYGDERERLRWYEGIAVAASVQWILVPWALAVLAWMADREVAPHLVVVAFVFYAPQFLVSVHLVRTKVDINKVTWHRKRVIATVATALPFLVMVVGLVRAFDEGLDPDGLIGGAIGGTVGGVAAILIARAVARRRVAEEGNMGDE